MNRNLLTGALAAGLTAVVAGAVAALPAAADHGHGQPDPTPGPTPPCALVSNASVDFLQDEYLDSDAVGGTRTRVLPSGVGTFTVTFSGGAASCTDVVYGVGAYHLVNGDVVELAYDERHGTGETSMVFRLPVPQHPSNCIRGFVRVLREGAAPDLAPNDLTDTVVKNQSCDPGNGSPAGTGWS